MEFVMTQIEGSGPTMVQMIMEQATNASSFAISSDHHSNITGPLMHCVVANDHIALFNSEPTKARVIIPIASLVCTTISEHGKLTFQVPCTE